MKQPHERDILAVLNYLWQLGDMTTVGRIEQVPVDQVLIAPFSQARIDRAVRKTRDGEIMPPIYVQRYFVGSHTFYQVTDGQHRTKACRILGLNTVPANVLGETTIDVTPLVLVENGLFRATKQTPQTGAYLLVARRHQFTNDQWAALKWLYEEANKLV